MIAAAEQGELQIVTSTYTWVEVLKDTSGRHPTADEAARIEHFFEQSYIVPVQLSRFVAHDARNLYWFEGVDQKDAVHLASALDAARAPEGLESLDTFDGGLHARSGETNPAIRIGRPDIPEQKALGESYEDD